jgi:hypothetical protein
MRGWASGSSVRGRAGSIGAIAVSLRLLPADDVGMWIPLLTYAESYI